jgi:hypothetical protein
MASAAVQPPAAPETVNSFGRIFGVIFSPKATFESIARRPTWLLPIVLLCIVSAGIVGLFSHRVGWRSLIEKQLTNNTQFQQLPPADQESRIQIALKYAPGVGYAEVVILPFLSALIFAGIFWMIFSMVVGAKLSFHTSLSVVSHGMVPSIIGGLIGILILSLKDPSSVDLQHLVASNAGAFLSSDSSKWLVALLSSVDLFLFWEMILVAIGYSATAPKKISFGSAMAWILGLWVLVVLLRVGIAAAMA